MLKSLGWFDKSIWYLKKKNTHKFWCWKVLVDLIKVLDIENIGLACDAQTRLPGFHNEGF